MNISEEAADRRELLNRARVELESSLASTSKRVAAALACRLLSAFVDIVVFVAVAGWCCFCCASGTVIEPQKSLRSYLRLKLIFIEDLKSACAVFAESSNKYLGFSWRVECC